MANSTFGWKNQINHTHEFSPPAAPQWFGGDINGRSVPVESVCALFAVNPKWNTENICAAMKTVKACGAYGSVLSAWRERPVSAAIAATGWPLLLLSAVPAGLAAVSPDPPKEYPQFEYCPSPSRTAHPVHRCRFIHATEGVCAQSSAPGSKQRPAELQVAAAAEFRRVIVDYLDRNVVEPQTILIEPPDGSANRSDRPVSGTVCR